MEPIKFIHFSDLHLGKRQYNLKERYKDYFRAFQWVLDRAISEKVDFILISGDLFDSKNINPSVLSDVFYSIRDFKERSSLKLKREIPMICIEGNHDNPIYTTNSWMSFLADLNLIILLAGNYDKENKLLTFQPYSTSNHRGGMFQIKDTIIYGLPYYGSFTKHLFHAIYQAISKKNNKFNILMMHFGVEGQDKSKPGIELTPNLKKLHDKIDYLALGHYHKNYILEESDQWIFNPGSLELNDLTELSYVRGAFLVEISGSEYYQKDLKILECDNGNKDTSRIPNREFFQIPPIDITGLSSFDKAIEQILKKLKQYGLPPREQNKEINKSDLNCPIATFKIVGEVGFSRLEINLNKLKDEIKKKYAVLDIRISSKDLFSALDLIKIEDDELAIDKIEQLVFSALIDQNEAYKSLKPEILNLLNDFKEELILKKPNYTKLKEELIQWSEVNIKDFAQLDLDNKEKTIIDSLDLSNLEKNIKVIKEKEIDVEEDQGFSNYDEFDDLDSFIDDGFDEPGDD
ncbi:MAG: metallophosphoesterase family protein [Promethearchaeota archaeon]